MGLFLQTGKCLLRSIQVPPKLSNPLPALQLSQDSIKEYVRLHRLLVHLGKSPKLLVKWLPVIPQTRIHGLQINLRSASHINRNSCAAIMISRRNSTWIKLRFPPISLKTSNTYFKSSGGERNQLESCPCIHVSCANWVTKNSHSLGILP